MSPRVTHYQRYSPDGLVNDEPITLSTLVVLDAAEQLGVSYEVLPGTKIIKLSYQGKNQFFRFQIAPGTTDIGFYASNDKRVTNDLLRAHGIQVPKGYGLNRQDPPEYWRKVYEALTKPLVVKPSHGNKGSAITIGITDYETYRQAVQKAFDFLNLKNSGVIVEELFNGKEYRVTVTQAKVLAIMHRIPANVVGDGQHTIQELIDIKNQDPRRGHDDTLPLVKINLDEDAVRTLSNQQLRLDSIPAKDQQVFFRVTSNISQGGDSVDVTDMAHPSVKTLALQAIQCIPGLPFAGVDFMTTDITAEQTPDTYRIVEINTSPGFSMHEFPVVGEARQLQFEFIYLAFPELRPPA